MCCEVLTIDEKFSISCVKLTVRPHPVSTELCEQPSQLYVSMFMISANGKLVVNGCVAFAGSWLSGVAMGGIYQCRHTHTHTHTYKHTHTHTHTHTQGYNRSLEAGLWVSATEALTIQIIQRPTNMAAPASPKHSQRRREDEQTHVKKKQNKKKKTHHYY